METKTLKIEIPKGYEIDKEKTTFENNVLKKIDDVVIKWDDEYKGVVINIEDEYFIVDASKPSYFCSWCDAMKFHGNGIWGLPTLKQVQILAKYIDAINETILDNGGYEIAGKCYWSCKEKDKSVAWMVSLNDGYTTIYDKCNNLFVRAVFTL